MPNTYRITNITVNKASLSVIGWTDVLSVMFREKMSTCLVKRNVTSFNGWFGSKQAADSQSLTRVSWQIAYIHAHARTHTHAHNHECYPSNQTSGRHQIKRTCFISVLWANLFHNADQLTAAHRTTVKCHSGCLRLETGVGAVKSWRFFLSA